jgi:hypothetical protein
MTDTDTCAFESGRPVYLQDWWSEIARGKEEFHEATVRRDDGAIVGRLSYIVTRSRVRRILPVSISFGGKPHWTHLSQPILDDTLNENGKREVLQKLMRQLPRNVSFEFIVAPDAKDKKLIQEAFTAAGFKHTAQINYSERPDAEKLKERMSKSYWDHIDRTNRKLHILGNSPHDPAVSATDFIQFYEANLPHGGKSYSPLKIAQALIEKGQKRGQIQIFAARRKVAPENEPWMAAIACAVDKERVYYWMTSHRKVDRKDPAHSAQTHAVKVLFFHAMMYARDHGRILDADGVPFVNGADDEGKKHFYGNIFKMPQENRDVYFRPAPLSRAFMRFRQAVRGLEHKITARPSLKVSQFDST